MIHLLKRHPLPIVAHFEWVLVLTYALPEGRLRPLLAPRLELDTWQGYGFMAVALVQTRGLRIAGLPRVVGQDFFLSGYRIFTRLDRLRGLQILRSDTDRRRMVVLGNLLTHYGYELASVRQRRSPDCLEVDVRTPGAVADLQLAAPRLGSAPYHGEPSKQTQVASEVGQAHPTDVQPELPRAMMQEALPLPPGSPFDSWHTARRFAGPLPHTFSYEQETGSVLVVRGLRQDWKPRPVRVDVTTCTFVPKEAVLASAFYLEDIPYRWERGWRA